MKLLRVLKQKKGYFQETLNKSATAATDGATQQLLQFISVSR